MSYNHQLRDDYQSILCPLISPFSSSYVNQGLFILCSPMISNYHSEGEMREEERWVGAIWVLLTFHTPILPALAPFHFQGSWHSQTTQVYGGGHKVIAGYKISSLR